MKRFRRRTNPTDHTKQVPPRPPSRIRERVRALRARFVFQRELRLRLLSAVILIPIVLFLTWYDEITFGVLVLVAGLLVLHEWMRMIGAGGLTVLRAVAFIGIGAVAVATLVQSVVFALGTLLLATIAAMAVASRHRFDIAVRWVTVGMLYCGIAVIAPIELRKGDDGFGAVIFVLLIAWATDIFAFFVGRKIGGPRLWRRVSPSKTWSGALGGLVAGVLFGALVAAFLNVPLGIATILAAALIAAAAEGGDLLESAAKRRFAIKDAGSLIPGHGGVMDRVDGVIAAVFVTVLLGSAVSGETPASGLLMLLGRS
ncbi:phosphatidate cytidylyltransferase [Acuticoccus sp. M5D2P5]|uniref:phosphatidate cytidylyltransferase n=1 Tax=Acuticoccus kalidii TaxID=2910977 RepID=UPI001F38C6B1|nr:phosphatidate cytidylyltransferase [Acuticoccus kalidii]MCF3935631.1 phosphatidate cytidylyltransferase [Acuticoccus kalidii]